jgi:hypothetical protein
MARLPTLATLLLLFLCAASIVQGGWFDRALYRKDDRLDLACKWY